MKIYIANDHSGVEMKNKIIDHLKKSCHDVINLGTDETTSVDYPDFGFKLAQEVVNNNTLGIAICGSGIGMSIATNKIKGVRAALCYEDQGAILARQHNNANILVMGARFIAIEKALRLVDIFLSTSFEERHTQRVEKINNK